MKIPMIVLSVIAVAASCAVHAAEPWSHWAEPGNSDARLIMGMEKAWGNGECGGIPTAALRDAIADDFQGTSTHGTRYDKSQALEPGHDHDCRLGQVRIRFFGGSLAVAYGSESNIATGSDGKESRRCAIWTDTWLKRDRVWQVIAAQDNLVACH